MNKLLKELMVALEQPLKDLSFNTKFSEQEFSHRDRNVDQIITLSFAYFASSGYYELDYHASVRHLELENLRRKYMVGLDDRYKKKTITISILTSNLKTQRPYDWKFRDSSDINRYKSDIIEHINCIAIPYFKYYSDLSNLESALECATDKSARNITTLFYQRYEILVCIYALRKQKDQFKKSVPMFRQQMENQRVRPEFIKNFEDFVSGYVRDNPDYAPI